MGTATRVGAVFLPAYVSRQLVAADSVEQEVEVVDDPTRFVQDGRLDFTSRRVLLIGLDGADNWSLLVRLMEWSDTCPVVGLARQDSDLLRALALGASGVLSIEADSRRILRAAEAAVDGDAMLPQVLLSRFSALLPPTGITSDAVSDEERRWLSLLAEGETVDKIAVQSGWSSRQMSRRFAGLYLRLGVANRDQAVALASRMGLV